MNFSMTRVRAVDARDDIISFCGEVRGSDLMRLSEHDRNMMDAILADPKPTPAEYLLCLEMIYRSNEDTTG